MLGSGDVLRLWVVREGLKRSKCVVVDGSFRSGRIDGAGVVHWDVHERDVEPSATG